MYDCVYLRLYQSRVWDEDEFEEQVIDKDFGLMYGENNFDTLKGDAFHFSFRLLTLQNNRLYHFDFETLKLYELKYNDKTQKIELNEVKDHTTIEKFFKGFKVIYTSDFKQIHNNALVYEATYTYPKKFIIYNDVTEPLYDFYRAYFRQNSSIDSDNFEHACQFLIKRPTTVEYDSGENIFKMIFK